MWRFAVRSPLSSSEVFEKITSYFHSQGWTLYEVEGAYIAEGPRVFHILSLLFLLIGILVSLIDLSLVPIGFILLVIGVILSNERHTVALGYRNGVILVIANTSEAYQVAMGFVKEVNGSVMFPEETGGRIIAKTDYAKSLEELGTVILGATGEASTPAPSEATHEPTKTYATNVYEPPKKEDATQDSEDALRKYEEYLAKLEELKNKGEVSEEVYMELRKEYEEKIEELKKKVKERT